MKLDRMLDEMKDLHRELFGRPAPEVPEESLLPLPHGFDPVEDWKETRQRACLARHESVGLVSRERFQVATQSIDQGVECLVGHRLLFVAAAGQDHGLTVP